MNKETNEETQTPGYRPGVFCCSIRINDGREGCLSNLSRKGVKFVKIYKIVTLQGRGRFDRIVDVWA